MAPPPRTWPVQWPSGSAPEAAGPAATSGAAAAGDSASGERLPESWAAALSLAAAAANENGGAAESSRARARNAESGAPAGVVAPRGAAAGAAAAAGGGGAARKALGALEMGALAEGIVRRVLREVGTKPKAKPGGAMPAGGRQLLLEGDDPAAEVAGMVTVYPPPNAQPGEIVRIRTDAMAGGVACVRLPQHWRPADSSADAGPQRRRAALKVPLSMLMPAPPSKRRVKQTDAPAAGASADAPAAAAALAPVAASSEAQGSRKRGREQSSPRRVTRAAEAEAAGTMVAVSREAVADVADERYSGMEQCEEVEEGEAGDEAEVQKRRLDEALGDRAYIWVRPPEGTVAGGTFRVKFGEFILTLRTKAGWTGNPVRVSRTFDRPLLALMPPASADGTANASTISAPRWSEAAQIGSEIAEIFADAPTADSSSATAADAKYALTLPSAPGSGEVEGASESAAGEAPPLVLVRLPNGGIRLLRVPDGSLAGQRLECVAETEAEASGSEPTDFEIEVPPRAAARDSIIATTPSGRVVRFTLPASWIAAPEERTVRVAL